MAYETASASSVNDLIDKLRIFALANGWTVDFNGSSGLGTGIAVLLHKGGVYVGFATNTATGTSEDPGPRVLTYYYTGPYSSGSGPLAQAGHSGTTDTNNMPGPFQAYHFFASGTYLHVVVEVAPGSFRHFGVGVLEKAGSVTTGVYAHGSFWNYATVYVSSFLSSFNSMPFDDQAYNNVAKSTVIRCDSDAISPRHGRVVDSASGSVCGGYRRSSAGTNSAAYVSGLAHFGPSALTGRAPLLPLFCSVFRPSGNLSIIGAPPDLRAVRIDNIAPGELITLGPDDWKVFPAIRKNGVSGQENSNAYGYAYRVVP